MMRKQKGLTAGCEPQTKRRPPADVHARSPSMLLRGNRTRETSHLHNHSASRPSPRRVPIASYSCNTGTPSPGRQSRRASPSTWSVDEVPRYPVISLVWRLTATLAHQLTTKAQRLRWAKASAKPTANFEPLKEMLAKHAKEELLVRRYFSRVSRAFPNSPSLSAPVSVTR